MLFNRNVLTVGPSIKDPSNDEIKATPSLWNASLDDAIRFGGELTRLALSRAPIMDDHKYITVDTKIHMLLPGMYPSIPGWHTDGVPRHDDGSPAAGGDPRLDLQEKLDREGRAPRYHLLVTGTHCSTEFATELFDFWLESVSKSSDLYKSMSEQVEARYDKTIFKVPPATWVTWDWWNIHRAVPASAGGWRFLIRVTESDFLLPQTDVRQIIRLHNPVYLPSTEYGW